ncbi:flagellar basal body rod C-terminal domain-containing protein [Thalassobius sp. Cn5-15]|uniref:FlgK family flagellar hook-associated protein n=1 Tax=Thalassobius sp. Cn5-15 TaxID=2917763 RepID=UPI001EF174E1|nr:flagellar basal body rod C-terminal domain-containing protein [Thalassobius sp. Cn5-15]MCG7492784.1 flagellar basal body protein [Thalassobius sp. Cn5-15]
MADILNIGRSGMMAFRAALTVTSENVANANTDGYARRSVITKEAAGSASSPFYANASGQGVLVDDIRRAFDELVVAQVRNTGSAVASASTMHPAMEQLENRLLPDAGGVEEMLSGYFEAIEGLAANPEDKGMRAVVLESGRGLATAIADMATDVRDLGEYMHAQGGQVLDRINGLLKEAHKLQTQMGLSSVPGADNAVLDRRDKLLNDLSELVDIRVEYNNIGVATVTLGSAPGGPTLLSQDGPARLTLNADLSLNVRGATAGSLAADAITRSPSAGQLHGLYATYSAVQATLSDLAGFAGSVTDQINVIHQSSRDGNGAAGARMFSLNGWDAVPSPHNAGSTLAVAAEVEGQAPPTDPIKLVYDGTAGAWNAYDSSNTLLGSGTTSISLGNVEVQLTGAAVDGDVITLEPTHGSAENMRFLLTDTDQIASGGALVISPNVANTGTSALIAEPANESFTSLPTVASLLPTDGSSQGLLSAGVVGIIPADATEVSLASLAGSGTASDIMVFTREGTQIAGPVLSGAAATSLLTTANGFADGAIYDSTLTGQANNYLGTKLSTDGSTAATQWLRLSDLPAEDLIVVAGAGNLEIGGSVTTGALAEQGDRAVTVQVVDATTGEVAVVDQTTGHRLGGGILDGSGNAQIAGFDLTLAAGYATGDQFDVTASSSGTGDARGLSALAALRTRDNSSGLGGFHSILTEIRTEVGGLTSAAKIKEEVTEAQHEAALTAHQAAAGVDLDTEAANLMKFQQAYQANARIMTVAQELFSTLMTSLR